MSLATLFLIANENLLTNMVWWLCGVLLVLSMFLFNRYRIRSHEQE